ncbi:SLC13 family permease [Marinobacterium zhoushanense]|uniref:SLC13 family permease n=1 Tax=Marinobacterium zhoushanense TaxID=1679163 RepID=A0ABQ1KG73_9GAMM|nr:SLC13 family permease [Marinobacterium zhoushanense]GGB95997.1 SLC13 family permease [Marinobacterium zhoushanense]
MTMEMGIVFALLVGTILLFVSDRVRMDLVALIVVTLLAASGIVTPAEAVSGFGNSTVIMIAALFIVGEGLYRTGVAAAAGNWLLRVGGASETRLLLYLLPVVALLSAFMSSTGAVALLIPVVLSMARKSGMQPSRLMMPLAFAALIGGMLTLIGTPPNIVVSNALKSEGLEPFGFFEFTPIGLAILLVGMVYLIGFGRRLLPSALVGGNEDEPDLNNLIRRYAIAGQLHKLKVQAQSPLAHKTPVESALRTEHNVTVIAIARGGHLLSAMIPVLSNTRIEVADELWVYGTQEDIKRFCSSHSLISAGHPERDIKRMRQRFGVAEVLLPPDTPLEGKSVREGQFRERYGLSVIGLRRRNEVQQVSYRDTRLAAGDTLLLAGSWEYIRALEGRRGLVLLQTPLELKEIPSHAQRAPLALLILALMLICMTVGWLAALPTILLAAMAMILTGCVSLTEALRSMNVTSLILIAGMLPLAKAMEASGALGYVVSHLVTLLGGASPVLLSAGLFLFTSLLSQFISNTATTVLVAPIALSTAQLLGVNPEPLMMTVAIAASTAFATPIASPVNTLVLAPGNYRFADFAKVGIPLQLLALGVTLLLTPMLFPF